MKRLILHLMCAVLVISSFCAHGTNVVASTEPTIVISDETCNPGDEISLSVSLEANPGIMYLSVTPKCYDSEGEETDYLNLSAQNGELFSLVDGKNLVFDSDSNITENGLLCTLNVAVAEDAPIDEYSVELILRECYNSSEQDVAVDITAGTVAVEKAHIAGTAVVENEVKASCEEAGSYDSVIYCEDCGIELSRQNVVVPKTGHTEVTVKGKNATCTATGLTEGKKCSKCNKIMVAQNTIPKKAHNEVAVKVVAATCTNAGKTAGKKCSVCGKITQKQNTVKALGHSYKTTTTKATTSKNGKIVEKCTRCGDVYNTTTIYAAKTIKLSKAEYVYTGKAIKPKVTVKDSKGKTISSKYYTVSSTSKNIGKGTAKITFKTRYSGSKTLNFTINPKKISGLKLKSPGKKKLKVSWKKDASVGGYQIQYATNSKFTKGKKTIKISSNKTVNRLINSLKSKGTYYVRIRGYKKVGSKLYYGEYCSAKKLKIK